jgi:hypothetical protein
MADRRLRRRPRGLLITARCNVPSVAHDMSSTLHAARRAPTTPPTRDNQAVVVLDPVDVVQRHDERTALPIADAQRSQRLSFNPATSRRFLTWIRATRPPRTSHSLSGAAAGRTTSTPLRRASGHAGIEQPNRSRHPAGVWPSSYAHARVSRTHVRVRRGRIHLQACLYFARTGPALNTFCSSVHQDSAGWCNGSTPRSGRGSWGSNPWPAVSRTGRA